MARHQGSSGTHRAPPPAGRAWRAVLGRDARYDGRFVYGVTSTGVFCQPSCPSRRPRREHVRFFADAAAAHTAGFRPCRRCRPASHGPSRTQTAIAGATAYLAEHLGRRVTLTELAAEVGLSPYHLQRSFKQAVGVSPREYQDALRHRRFVRRLRAGDTVSRATYEAGYGSSSRVYGRAEVRARMTPATYRRRAAGMHVQFATVAVPLGRLLVAYTADGVCAVELGDDDATLEATLRADFANATISPAPAGANAWVRDVADRARGRTPPGTVPLDVQGTAFQWKVWKALQRIPAGETRSYAEVARAIGRPAAVRAVASACARNPVALVVPCHRVVRSDGESGGYRWGAARKEHLLRVEAKAEAGGER
jgi:AraC family transcriptional regulator, regulatory protein of adaptative response / methylated-DNA-[protein]-cysteine methyltransferase